MKLHLDVFEGPLDLLLYLIKKDDLEISRVSIAGIAAQYLDYIETMKDLDIDLASEFLVMAAELAHIKSKSLLPDDKDETVEDGEDSAADKLVAKLRLYQKYKSLAGMLAARRWLGRDVFKRASFDMGETAEEPAERESGQGEGAPLEVSAYDLVRAFNDMLKRIPPTRRDHRVVIERVSVTERIYEILDQLRRAEHVSFADLFSGHVEKVEYIVTFLAVLEMGKLRMVRIYQTENYGPIRLQQSVPESVEAENPGSQVDAESVTYK